MKIAIGCDHGGISAKPKVLEYLNSKKIEYKDFGTFSTDSCDYPDFALQVAEAVASKQFDFGILICGTGIGMCIAANKVKGIRCAHVQDIFSAEMTRRHNDANIIALGARVLSEEKIVEFVDMFLKTSFDGGRHEKRVTKITEIENKYFK